MANVATKSVEQSKENGGSPSHDDESCDEVHVKQEVDDEIQSSDSDIAEENAEDMDETNVQPAVSHNPTNFLGHESELLRQMINQISCHFLAPLKDGTPRKMGSSVNDMTKNHVCEVCNKRYKYLSQLKTHEITHTSIKTYVCDLCNKHFRHKSDLVKHIRVHTNEKPFECDVCGKAFKHNSHLIGHKRLHTGEKPYACEQCDKHFSDKSTLIRHIRVHTGDRPYICEICHKTFTRKSYLNKHKLKHE